MYLSPVLLVDGGLLLGSCVRLCLKFLHFDFLNTQLG